MWGSLKLKLIALGGIILAVVAVITKIFFMGRASAKVDDMGRKLRRVEKANEIRASVRTSDDDKLRERLRKSGWLRD
jgi:hypothetical protein